MTTRPVMSRNRVGVAKSPSKDVFRKSKPAPERESRPPRGSVPPEQPLTSSPDPKQRVLEAVEEEFALERGIEDLVAEGLARPAKPVAKKVNLPPNMRGSVPPEQPVFTAKQDPREMIIDSVEAESVETAIQALVEEGMNTGVAEWNQIPKAPPLPTGFRI